MSGAVFDNLNALEAFERARVVPGDALRLLVRLQSPWTGATLDKPMRAAYRSHDAAGLWVTDTNGDERRVLWTGLLECELVARCDLDPRYADGRLPPET